jgi:hypothetical protein
LVGEAMIGTCGSRKRVADSGGRERLPVPGSTCLGWAAVGSLIGDRARVALAGCAVRPVPGFHMLLPPAAGSCAMRKMRHLGDRFHRRSCCARLK